MIGKRIAIWALMILSPWGLAAPITASSDPDAVYSIVNINHAGIGLEVITQRVGISGTSFTKRQFDCANRQVLFMGSSTSIADFENIKPDKETTPLFKGSLSRAISDVVCNDMVVTAKESQRADMNTP